MTADVYIVYPMIIILTNFNTFYEAYTCNGIQTDG